MPHDAPTPRPAARTDGGGVAAADIWRELSTQRERIKATADRTEATHGVVIKMAADMGALKDESRRTADGTGRLVALAELREKREAAADTARENALVAATEREAAAAAARASFWARNLGALVDWWVGSWKTVVLVLAILMGWNIEPITEALLGVSVQSPPMIEATAGAPETALSGPVEEDTRLDPLDPPQDP